MLIYIAGSGAMGCRFGYQLTKANHEVVLLDTWQKHIDAIKENGLKVVGAIEDNLPMNIITPKEATKEADLIILFTKAMQLEEMLSDIKGIIGKNTQVLCLLNGLGHEEVIKKYVDIENIIMGVTIWTAGLVEPGVVKLQGVGTIDLQSLSATNKENGLLVTKVLNEANLNATYSEDVLASIWRKACVNGTMNSLCSLLEGTIGEVFNTKNAEAVVRKIINEFITVAKAEGVVIDEAEIVDYVNATAVKAAAHYPSMYQDLILNKRYTEIDYINGAVYRKGLKLGIETPYCKLITELIHIKEELKIK